MAFFVTRGNERYMSTSWTQSPYENFCVSLNVYVTAKENSIGQLPEILVPLFFRSHGFQHIHYPHHLYFVWKLLFSTCCRPFASQKVSVKYARNLKFCFCNTYYFIFFSLLDSCWTKTMSFCENTVPYFFNYLVNNISLPRALRWN